MNYLNNFAVIVLSILIEAMPFMLIGAIVSAVIEVFISPEIVYRFLPKNKIMSIFLCGLMGIIFPVCECAIVPVVRRLVKKGVPFSSALTFMLSVPVLNPVVLSSTFIAFYPDKRIAILRGIMGYTVAVSSGIIWHRFFKDSISIEDKYSCHSCCHDHTGHNHASHEHPNHEHTGHDHSNHNHTDHDHTGQCKHKKNGVNIMLLLEHSVEEFFDIGKYLIAGSVIAALMQTFISREMITNMAMSPLIITVFMMGLAYVLSICSEADAFVARSFASILKNTDTIPFLVYGPVLDIKLTFMLMGAFEKKSVLKIMFIVTLLVFLITLPAVILR